MPTTKSNRPVLGQSGRGHGQEVDSARDFWSRGCRSPPRLGAGDYIRALDRPGGYQARRIVFGSDRLLGRRFCCAEDSQLRSVGPHSVRGREGDAGPDDGDSGPDSCRIRLGGVVRAGRSNSEIDGLLSATLAVDDFVDLGTLRKQAEHPPFTSEHEKPLSPPEPIQAPPEPVFEAPVEPKGLSGMFGGKRKFHDEWIRANTRFAAAHDAWQTEAGQVPMRQFEQMEDHRKAEEVRRAGLEAHMATYREECDQRQGEADADNAELDRLIKDLAAGKPDAVEEYFGLVFGNSVYPDGLPGVQNHSYDATTRELVVTLQLPSPEQIPTVKLHKYIKAKDEIAETQQTQKERRDRYGDLVNNMTLRTLHEVWESDRAGHVDTISLTGYVEHVDPATGNETQTPLVALAAERDRFLDIDLSRVTPSETLRHLNANLSKNPHELVGIDLGQGVRGH